MYIIRTERKEPADHQEELLWDLPEKTCWSHITGIFSTVRMASKFKSVEDAQPTLDWLRDECPHLRLQVIPLQ